MHPPGAGTSAMNAKQLGMTVVAAMVLIGGLAAVGAASPTAQANENATDASDGNAVDPVGDADDASENATTETDSVGPSDGLPEQVPDHVSKIHETIESFLSGTVEDLGGALGDLLGDGQAADGTAEAPTDANVAA